MDTDAKTPKASEANPIRCGRMVSVNVRLAGRDPPGFVEIDQVACRAWQGHEGPCGVTVDEATVTGILAMFHD